MHYDICWIMQEKSTNIQSNEHIDKKFVKKK